jgi:hypothetical protein
MTISLYGNVKDKGLVAPAELAARLNQLAICCRGLECAIDDFCGETGNDAAKRLSRLASNLASQSERLARAMAAEIEEPLT